MTTSGGRSCPAGAFISPEDFNSQLGEWVAKANTRRMRVLGCSPADRIAADKAAMMPLSTVAPRLDGARACGCRATTTYALTPRDCSVHPVVVGRRIEVHADLDRVWVTYEGAIVADHAKRPSCAMR